VNDLAVALDRSRSTINLRGDLDGTIDASVFAQLAHLPPETIENWRRQQLLNNPSNYEHASGSYRASDLIRALLDEDGGDREAIAKLA
jgi:hypothetical protein